jgi:hypothetical protein
MIRRLDLHWLFFIEKENDNEYKNASGVGYVLNKCVLILAQCYWLCELRIPPWDLAADGSDGSLLAAVLVNRQVVMAAEVEAVAKKPVTD